MCSSDLPYLLQTLSAHKSYRFRGNYEFKNGYVSLQNPTFELPGSSEDVRSVLPIYPETKQISSQLIRKLIKGCRDSFEEIPDVLPAEVIKQHSLLNKSEALRALHFADSLEQLELAKRTIGFEELFELVLAGMILKKNIKEFHAAPIDRKSTRLNSSH